MPVIETSNEVMVRISLIGLVEWRDLGFVENDQRIVDTRDVLILQDAREQLTMVMRQPCQPDVQGVLFRHEVGRRIRVPHASSHAFGRDLTLRTAFAHEAINNRAVNAILRIVGHGHIIADSGLTTCAVRPTGGQFIVLLTPDRITA
jgi:hypothetical protein